MSSCDKQEYWEEGLRQVPDNDQEDISIVHADQSKEELGSWLFYPGLEYGYIQAPLGSWRKRNQGGYEAVLLQVPNFNTNPRIQDTLKYFENWR